MTRTSNFVALIVAMALAASAGCTVSKQDAPATSGPSVLATSITMYASPDTLRRDGASQSQITVQALDANSNPMRNLPIRLEIAVGGVLADFGQLSAKNVYTGSDGRASALYTAPLPAAEPVDTQTVVQIMATPVGSDYGNSSARYVSIRLVPPGIILPPNGTPVAAFVYAPSAPITQSDVTFDATSSTDADGQIVTYSWNFGDGSTGTGSVVRHQFSSGGAYTVVLTVTDDRGLSASKSLSVAVTESAAPTADFVMSPTNPVINQEVFFNANASKASTGRRITRYDWDFGSGTPQSGVTVSKAYDVAATYTITLVVTDDAGMRGTTSKTLTVSAGASTTPTASFTFSPTLPTAGQTVFFNGSASTSPAGIASYAWDFGDGSTGTGVTPSHSFATAATYVVRLTITDNSGRTATTTSNVTVSSVSPSTPPTARFVFSPASPAPSQSVFFDASQSSAASGRTIAAYEWNFGDAGSGTGRTVSHAYANDGVYTVVLTVRDDIGQVGTTTVVVTVGAVPVANFAVSPSPATAGQPIVVDASTSTPQATIVSYEWNFGDSTTIESTSNRTFTHTYTTAGTYTITLRVTDSAGRKASSTKEIKVN
ncbi:MAG: PKD domain-containing protein [Acidobacteria bacterium]|nr:PKD domain-containing protein [Acidobacteriota bacterium]